MKIWTTRSTAHHGIGKIQYITGTVPQYIIVA